MIRRTIALLLVTLAGIATACGGDEPRVLTGYRRDPAPQVGELSLPDVADGGAPYEFRADPGELLVVYFGYTNCPDFCPTTLSDLRLATRRLDESDAERIEVAMVTVDPNRDLPILVDYIRSFFDDGHALGSEDDRALAEVAAPFGVGYEVRETDDGIEVDHTTALYAIDDRGELALTWQFGVTIDDLAKDLDILLNDRPANESA